MQTVRYSAFFLKCKVFVLEFRMCLFSFSLFYLLIGFCLFLFYLFSFLFCFFFLTSVPVCLLFLFCFHLFLLVLPILFTLHLLAVCLKSSLYLPCISVLSVSFMFIHFFSYLCCCFLFRSIIFFFSFPSAFHTILCASHVPFLLCMFVLIDSINCLYSAMCQLQASLNRSLITTWHGVEVLWVIYI